jgi:hypothetical protein
VYHHFDPRSRITLHSIFAVASGSNSHGCHLMLLSAFVRSSERPPLAFLAGWPYLLIGTVELTIAIWYLLPTLGLAGLLIHVGIGVPLLIVDALKSNHFGWNLVSLRANGFSDANVAFTVLFNLVASQGLTCLVFQYFGITAPLTLMTTTSATELAPIVAWMGRAAAVAVNLCLTEAAFFLAHRELHLNSVQLIVFSYCILSLATRASSFISSLPFYFIHPHSSTSSWLHSTSCTTRAAGRPTRQISCFIPSI